MTVIAELGLVGLLAIVGVVLLIAITALGATSARGSSLEWNPDERIEFQMSLQEDDLDEMLALHNAKRRQRGLPELSEAEYLAQVRRNAPR